MEIQSIRSIKTKHKKLLYVLLALMTVGVWGMINLLKGYGNGNPGAKSQGMKRFIPK